MDAQGTMRLMFDTMDAYDRGDFERLAEIYAEDATWIAVDPSGPHCRSRDDIFEMFRGNLRSGVRIRFGELRSTPTHVTVAAQVDDSVPVVTVFSFEGRRIVAVQDYPSMGAASSALRPVRRGVLGRLARFFRDLPKRMGGQPPPARRPRPGYR
jgi:ketosteroid isomerase-like protein